MENIGIIFEVSGEVAAKYGISIVGIPETTGMEYDLARIAACDVLPPLEVTTP